MTAEVARARRGLAIYLLGVAGVSAVLEWRLLRAGDPIGRHPMLVFLLMWTPALASLVARAALRDGIGDVSFRWGGPEGWKAIGIGWAYPAVVGLAAYGAAWASGLARFSPPALDALGMSAGPPAARFVALLAIAASVATLLSALSAAGEEFGWRGYMLTRLIDAKVPAPVLTSGLIWAVWHTPLILSGQYAAGPRPLLSAGVFVVDVVAIACLMAWLRLRTGSVWPAVMVHAAWNAIIQGAFDASTAGASIWVGESGILVAAVNAALVAALIGRAGWRRHGG